VGVLVRAINREKKIPVSQQIQKREITLHYFQRPKGRFKKEIERLTEDCGKIFHLFLGILTVTSFSPKQTFSRTVAAASC